MVAREKKPQAAIKFLFSLLLVMVVSGNPGDVLALAGGGGQDHPAGAACQADEDCQSGFCDAGVCRLPEGQYGAVCTPAPRTAEGLRDGKLNACGAYICSEDRCRSCNSDSQCQQEYGAPTCRLHPTRPGKRCGA
jgi:hypothetical protein